MNARERLKLAIADIDDALALLRFAAEGLPLAERHLFLQGVLRLEDAARTVAGMLEPVSAP